MSSTRRDFFRDATLLTLAGAVGTRSMMAKGPSCQMSYTTGVRVFFGGGWLFYPDPSTKDSMLAVTFDPHHEPHIFPTGPWVQPPPDAPQGWWNRHGAKLDLSESTLDNPHTVTIGGALLKSNSLGSVTNLFNQANQATAFTYMATPPNGSVYSVSNAGPKLKLRVVRVPVPISILPLTYRMDAQIQDPGKLFTNLKTNAGVATMFIFQYPEGTSLSLDGQSQFSPEAGHPMDFHFHVLPKNPNPPKDHSAEMFADLLSLIQPPVSGASLTVQGTENTVWGPCIPRHVTRAEAELPTKSMDTHVGAEHADHEHRLMMGSLASCCSGSIGVGGGGGVGK